MDFFGFSDVRIRILLVSFRTGLFGFSWIWILGISLDLDSLVFLDFWTWLLFLGLDRFFLDLDALDFLGFGFIRGHYVFSVELMNASHFVCF